MNQLIATLLFIAWMYAALTFNGVMVGALTVVIFILEMMGKQ